MVRLLAAIFLDLKKILSFSFFTKEKLLEFKIYFTQINKN